MSPGRSWGDRPGPEPALRSRSRPCGPPCRAPERAPWEMDRDRESADGCGPPGHVAGPLSNGDDAGERTNHRPRVTEVVLTPRHAGARAGGRRTRRAGDREAWVGRAGVGSRRGLSPQGAPGGRPPRPLGKAARRARGAGAAGRHGALAHRGRPPAPHERGPDGTKVPHRTTLGPIAPDPSDPVQCGQLPGPDANAGAPLRVRPRRASWAPASRRDGRT